MNRGGRPTDLVWQHYYKVERDGKHCAKCKNCGSIRANRVERMKSHLSQCLQKKKEESNLEVETIGIDLATSTQPEVLMKKRKIDPFIVKTSNDSSQKLDLLVAKFFYANNIPFSIIEHFTFHELVSALRPGYCIPNRKALAGPLLDKVVAEVVETAKVKLTGKAVTLIEDGWSNVHNDPVIASCIHDAGKAYFLDAVESGTNTKNADYHKHVIENAIQKAKDKFGCEVKVVVTDNAKVMEKTRQLLHESDTNLVVYGCSSHLLNLLGQALTPEVIKQVIKIQKYFRNHHLPGGWLREFLESLKPQLPGDTRWNSQLTCIDTFMHNRQFFQKIVEEHEDEIDTDIARLINDYNLYKQCKDLVLQLKPISIGLDTLQRDTASLADACIIWLSLMTEDSIQPHIEAVQQRLEQALKPLHFLAYLMHPKYMGEGLTTMQMESARTWATEKVSNCLPLLIAFEAGEAPFPASYFSSSAKSTNPVTWWKAFLSVKVFTRRIVRPLN